MSEITPRNDTSDDEVHACSNLLNNHASSHADITIATHSNSSWCMYRDEKHIKNEKIAKFAADLIKALKTAYGITSKRKLES